MKKIALNLLICLSLLGSLSCSKPIDNDDIVNGNKINSNGIIILNEGLWGQNNASLSSINLDSISIQNNLFKNINGIKLGDVGNDMIIYGNKIYIIVNSSSKIEIIDKNTFKIIESIPLFNNQIARQPRQFCTHKNHVFFTTFDGFVGVIDTNSLSVEKYIKVGRNPEGIAYQNNKLYVANSGGLDFPNYDSTVSVIDIETLKEIKKITVRINPNNVIADDLGNIYVSSRGNHNNTPPLLQKIDTYRDQLLNIPNIRANGLWFNNDTLYMTLINSTTGKGSIASYSTFSDQIINNNLIPSIQDLIVYGFGIHPFNGDLFVCTSKSYTATGSVQCFTKNGTPKFSLKAGLLPSKIAFINNNQL